MYYRLVQARSTRQNITTAVIISLRAWFSVTSCTTSLCTVVYILYIQVASAIARNWDNIMVRSVFFNLYNSPLPFLPHPPPSLHNQYSVQQYDACDVSAGGGGYLLLSYCLGTPQVHTRMISVIENSNTVAGVPDFRSGRTYYLASKWSHLGREVQSRVKDVVWMWSAATVTAFSVGTGITPWARNL